jgi:uncharacterized protein
MASQHLKLLAENFAIHQFPAAADIPVAARIASPVWIARTVDELSIVCAEHIDVSGERVDIGWRCLEVAGPFDLSTTVGVLSDLTRALADAGISLFAVSTFNTDYVLVKADRVHAAQDALERAGHTFGPC